MILILFILLSLSCPLKQTKTNKDQDKIFIGIDTLYEKSFYAQLSKKIVKSFLKKNNIKKFEFISYNNKNIDKPDIFITDNEINNNSLFSLKLFKDAIYFISEEKYLKDFNYPNSLSNINMGIKNKSLSQEYLKTNLYTHNNIFIYDDINKLIEDFNNRKIDLIIIDRADYYKYILFLPKKYLFFVEIGDEFGYIYFKNIKEIKLFELFLKDSNIVEKEWIKFVL